MGSGTTAVVAQGLNRQFVGFEISEQYCKIANERLERNKLYPEIAKLHPLKLF